VSSSRRGKEHIEDLGLASRKILDLRPVQFTYKEPFADGSTPIQYGLIAEEVAQVLPELVVHGREGQVETVKYHVLPTLVLAEVQRLERERTKHAEEIAALRAMVDELTHRLCGGGMRPEFCRKSALAQRTCWRLITPIWVSASRRLHTRQRDCTLPHSVDAS
jgi:hypothetical protein